MGDGGASTSSTNSGSSIGSGGETPVDGALLAVDFEASFVDNDYTPSAILHDFAEDDLCFLPKAVGCPGLVRPTGENTHYFSWPASYEGKPHAVVVTDPEDPNNRVLSMLLPAGKKVHPRHEFNVRFRDEDGLTHARLSYDIYIDGDLSYPTKLPRLRGFRPGHNYLHEDPDADGPGGTPTYGFTNAPALDGERLYLYHYWSDQTNDCRGNSHFPEPAHSLTPHAWHHIDLVTHLNSIDNGVGVDDGSYELWLDGELLWVTEGLRLRDTEDLTVNTFTFTSWNNGTKEAALSSDVYVLYDNFVVIAHDDPPATTNTYAYGKRTEAIAPSQLEDCPGHDFNP